eukprot:5041-Heterococcus_DN1.PRE.1
MRSCQLSNSFQHGSTKALAIHAWHRFCEGGCASSSYSRFKFWRPFRSHTAVAARLLYQRTVMLCLHLYADVLHAATTANSLLSLIAVTAATGTALKCCYCRCCSDADWLLATQASCMISATRTRLCSLSRHHSRRLHSGVHVLLSAYGTCTHHTCTRWKAAGRLPVHGHVDKLHVPCFDHCHKSRALHSTAHTASNGQCNPPTVYVIEIESMNSACTCCCSANAALASVQSAQHRTKEVTAAVSV